MRSLSLMLNGLWRLGLKIKKVSLTAYTKTHRNGRAILNPTLCGVETLEQDCRCLPNAPVFRLAVLGVFPNVCDALFSNHHRHLLRTSCHWKKQEMSLDILNDVEWLHCDLGQHPIMQKEKKTWCCHGNQHKNRRTTKTLIWDRWAGGEVRTTHQSGGPQARPHTPAEKEYIIVYNLELILILLRPLIKRACSEDRHWLG